MAVHLINPSDNSFGAAVTNSPLALRIGSRGPAFYGRPYPGR